MFPLNTAWAEAHLIFAMQEVDSAEIFRAHFISMTWPSDANWHIMLFSMSQGEESPFSIIKQVQALHKHVELIKTLNPWRHKHSLFSESLPFV